MSRNGAKRNRVQADRIENRDDSVDRIGVQKGLIGDQEFDNSDPRSLIQMKDLEGFISNVTTIRKVRYNDLESDRKTYISESLANKFYYIYQQGIQRFLNDNANDGEIEYTIDTDGGFELLYPLNPGDFVMIIGEVSSGDGGGSPAPVEQFIIVNSYTDIILHPTWGGDTEITYYVTTDNQNMGGKKGAYKYVPTFTPTPAQIAINFND